MARRDEEFREAGPAPGAENMFADDPEMLELIGAARKRQEKEGPARRKPLWWQLLMVMLGLVWAVAAIVPSLALEIVPFHPLQPLTGLLGGMLLALGILGHHPGRYRIVDEMGQEREKATLWKQLSGGLRAGAFAAAFVLPGAAYGLLMLQ